MYIETCVHAVYFYPHQWSCKTSHTKYEKENMYECETKYNYLDPPMPNPPNHACPLPYTPLPPSPPLLKLPHSTPNRAPVARRQRERDELRRHSQSILQREGEKGKGGGRGS